MRDSSGGTRYRFGPGAAPGTVHGRNDPTKNLRVGTPCLTDRGQPRGTQRYVPTVRTDEDVLTNAVVTVASEYGRYGCRGLTALLRSGGLWVGEDRVQRIWRRAGLKVPKKQRLRGRLLLDDGGLMECGGPSTHQTILAQIYSQIECLSLST